jgi:hypothetical protein
MNKPTKQEITAAMDTLKAAGCIVETKARDISDWTSIVFVVHVPLSMMENV